MPAHRLRQVAVRDWRPSNAFIINQGRVHDSAQQCHLFFFLVFIKSFKDIGIVVGCLHVTECALSLLWCDNSIRWHVGRIACMLDQHLLGVPRLLLGSLFRFRGIIITITNVAFALLRRNVATLFHNVVEMMRQALGQNTLFFKEFPCYLQPRPSQAT